MSVFWCLCSDVCVLFLSLVRSQFQFCGRSVRPRSERECGVDKDRRVQVSTVRSPWETSQEEQGRIRDAWWTPLKAKRPFGVARSWVRVPPRVLLRDRGFESHLASGHGIVGSSPTSCRGSQLAGLGEAIWFFWFLFCLSLVSALVVTTVFLKMRQSVSTPLSLTLVLSLGNFVCLRLFLWVVYVVCYYLVFVCGLRFLCVSCVSLCVQTWTDDWRLFLSYAFWNKPKNPVRSLCWPLPFRSTAALPPTPTPESSQRVTVVPPMDLEPREKWARKSGAKEEWSLKSQWPGCCGCWNKKKRRLFE